mgnify:CR=1 FL=1
MTLQPAILEMGMGIDLHGQNYTRAASRAVWNAVHQSSLMLLNIFGPDLETQEMYNYYTPGVPPIWSESNKKTETKWLRSFISLNYKRVTSFILFQRLSFILFHKRQY